MILVCVIGPRRQHQVRWRHLPAKAVQDVFYGIPMGRQPSIGKLVKLSNGARQKCLGRNDRLALSFRVAGQGQPIAACVTSTGELKQRTATANLDIVGMGGETNHRQWSSW
jgi:hypothetical protein